MGKNSLHLEHLQKAIHSLGRAFSWDSSDEGYSFWQDVVMKLEGYAQRAKDGESCRKEIAELKNRIAELELRC